MSKDLFSAIEKKNSLQRFFMVLSFLVIIIGGGLRLYEIPRHFTNTDDIGVAFSILEARTKITSVESLRQIIHNPLQKSYTSGKMVFLRKLDDKGLLEPVFNVFAQVTPFVAVPLRWTYGSVEYFFTAALVTPGHDYRETLSRGRLPSWFFGIGAIIGVGIVLLRRNRTLAGWASATVAMTVMACSWEHFIHSIHMSSYAIGVFAIIALLAWLVRRTEMDVTALNWKGGIAATGLAVLLLNCQYQMIFIFPVGLAVLFLKYFQENPKNWKKTVPYFSIAITGWLAVTAFLFLLLLQDYGLRMSYNAGPHGEYVFSAPQPFMAKLSYGFAFFFNNGWATFCSLVGIWPDTDVRNHLLSACLFVFMLAGIYRLLTHPLPGHRHIGRFIVGTFVVFLIMYSAGRFTLSPTRHNLILLPLLAIAIGEGTVFVSQSLKLKEAGSLIVTIFLLAVFLSEAPNQLARRQDLFQESALLETLKQHHVDILVMYGATYSVDMMPSVKASIPVINIDDRNAHIAAPVNPSCVGRWAFLSHRSGLSPETWNYIGQQLSLLGIIRADHLPNQDQMTLITQQIIPIQTDMEFSSKIESGGNGFFLNILENPPSACHS